MVPGRGPPDDTIDKRAQEELDVQRLAANLLRRFRAARFLITLDLEVEATALPELLCVSPKTLDGWRQQSIGPPSRTVRRVALYEIRALASWMLDQKHGRSSLSRALLNQ